jgi:hypothetical protein
VGCRIGSYWPNPWPLWISSQVEWLTLAEIDMARLVLSDGNPLMPSFRPTGLTSSRWLKHL